MPTYAQIFEESNNVSLESMINGQMNIEIEYTIYARIPDLQKIKQLAIETHRHEQWSMPLQRVNSDGKLRLRLIDDSRPTMCSKIKREGMVGCEEVEQDISMPMFNALREMAEGGYIKTRYTIPSTIPGLEWEVDVFLSNGGADHEWVKIDLEVKDVNTPIPPLPFDTSRLIVAVGDLAHSDRAQVKRLWDEEWLRMDISRKKQ